MAMTAAEQANQWIREADQRRIQEAKQKKHLASAIASASAPVWPAKKQAAATSLPRTPSLDSEMSAQYGVPIARWLSEGDVAIGAAETAKVLGRSVPVAAVRDTVSTSAATITPYERGAAEAAALLGKTARTPPAPSPSSCPTAPANASLKADFERGANERGGPRNLHR